VTDFVEKRRNTILKSESLYGRCYVNEDNLFAQTIGEMTILALLFVNYLAISSFTIDEFKKR
jgi:hypothetical protein